MPNEDVAKFLDNLKSFMNKLSTLGGQCILCRKLTYKHVIVLSDEEETKDAIMYTAPNKLRYGIASICEDHNLEDPDIGRQVKIAARICLESPNKTLYVKSISDMSDE